MEESRSLFVDPATDGPAKAADGAEAEFTTGILPCQDLRRVIHLSKEIRGIEPITDDQIQPASLDLRLGAIAYRVRASFLPGSRASVQEKLREFSMHEMDISTGGV